MIDFKNLPDTTTPLSAEILNQMQSELLKAMNPVGTIRMSANNVNPSTYLGFGTWVAWGSGRVPVGVDGNDTNFNTTEKTGGANSHSYTPAGTLSTNNGNTGSTTLTTNQIPSHSHSLNYTYGVDNWGLQSGSGGYSGSIYFGNNDGKIKNQTTNSAGGGQGHTHTLGNHGHTFTGTASTQSHLQKYITCYMWKRTA